MQKQEKNSTGHRSSFSIKLSFGIGHPHLFIKCSVYVWGRAQGSQIFKQNSIISIHSKVMAFLVILLSPWSPHGPHHPHVVPIIPASSPLSPHHPHSPQKVPIIPVVPTHVVPIVPVTPTSFLLYPHHQEGPQIIPNPPHSHPTNPPPPWGVGDLKSLKMQ